MAAGAIKPCAGKGVNPSAAGPFAAGRDVEKALDRNLKLARREIQVAPRLYSGLADRRTGLSYVTAIQNRLLDGPGWSQQLITDLTGHVTGGCPGARGKMLAGLITELDARNATGRPRLLPDRRAPADPPAPRSDRISAAFRSLFAVDLHWPDQASAPALAPVRGDVDALEGQLPKETGAALVRVIRAMIAADKARLVAIDPWFPGEINFESVAQLLVGRLIPNQLVRSFDYRAMARSSMAVALAVENLSLTLEEHPLPETLDFRAETPLGDIVLRGAVKDDTYTGGKPALVVDAGGNDTYNGIIAAPSSPSIPVSVLIDSAGNDRYAGGQTVGTQGAARLSVGILIDKKGDDEYAGGSLAQGTGSFGTGILLDAEGNDRYRAQGKSQGAGVGGIGIAVDLKGNDSWHLITSGQGYAQIRSSGLLLDAEGDDEFIADDTNIEVPSAQSPDHNSSLAQGMGTGQQAPDGALHGGTGILADLKGNDRFSCAVFCQGAGYYFGHGVLYDGAGDDAYRGVWYTQGSAAHFALGTFMDESGSDRYEAVIKGAQGEGHDQSAGFFLDGAGNDEYTSTGLSHGVANNIGFGFFVDRAGDDVYGTAGGAAGEEGWFGQAALDGLHRWTPVNRTAVSLGAFFDLGGNDDYRVAPQGPANGKTWKLGVWTTSAYRGPKPGQLMGYGEDRGG